MKGHDWETYHFLTDTELWGERIEKAGRCRQCGFDTHDAYQQKVEHN